MKISVITFQKHRNAELEAVEKEYVKRLARYAKIEIVTIKNWSGQYVLPERFRRATHIVGLYIEGQQFSSEEIAQRIEKLMNTGRSHLVFIIGSADGIPAEISNQLNERWSLSMLTFSHHLARLLLFEVIYRSFDILRGGSYHK